MSAFVFIPYGYYGIRVPDNFIRDVKFAQVYTGPRMPKINDRDYAEIERIFEAGRRDPMTCPLVPLQTRNNRVFLSISDPHKKKWPSVISKLPP